MFCGNREQKEDYVRLQWPVADRHQTVAGLDVHNKCNCGSVISRHRLLRAGLVEVADNTTIVAFYLLSSKAISWLV